jgi:hypothetical protein
MEKRAGQAQRAFGELTLFLSKAPSPDVAGDGGFIRVGFTRLSLRTRCGRRLDLVRLDVSVAGFRRYKNPVGKGGFNRQRLWIVGTAEPATTTAQRR